jgi:DNA-3-methyladenine glycosylase
VREAPGAALRLDDGRPTEEVAVGLLGHRLAVLGDDGAWASGEIVETEAYLGPSDRACHSSRGRTARTEVMFGRPGRAYVFLIYGVHWCFNVVTGGGAAVLVRAVAQGDGPARPSGPGRLTRALGIAGIHNGLPLDRPPIMVVAAGGLAGRAVARGRRVGVDYAGPRWSARRLRFWIRGHPAVSAGR